MKGVLSIQGVPPLEESDEAASPAHSTVLVPQHIELVNSTKLLEEVLERILVHGPRHLADEHLDGVVVRDVGGVELPGVPVLAAVLFGGSHHLVLEVGRCHGRQHLHLCGQSVRRRINGVLLARDL